MCGLCGDKNKQIMRLNSSDDGLHCRIGSRGIHGEPDNVVLLGVGVFLVPVGLVFRLVVVSIIDLLVLSVSVLDSLLLGVVRRDRVV